jgi:RHS repeat-associated protein
MAGGVSVIGLGYDAQGNLANKNGVFYTFDYGNRLRAGELETYRYDAQGRRIRSSSSAGLVYSLYAQSGQLLFQRDERSGKRRQYIYLGGSLVAESDMPLTGSTATVTYQHTDALGTPVAITNSSKTVIERREYEPYGYQTTPTLQDGPNYTGHVADAATGLVYMQARYYDPMLGLFVNVDPMPVDMTNGSNFNRYWYANSNPLTLIDPDGRATCADKKCETSTIDPVLPRGNSQPPPVNGTEGLPPKIADKVDDGYATTVTFQNDDPKGADPNQPVQTSTAVMVEHAISDASVNSVNINSTTGGKHGVHSNHARGRAVDINRVNGQRVNSSNAAAAQVQIAARNGGEVRENFGPTIMEKTSVPGGSPHHVDNASLAKDHQNHIHLSGQP